MLHRGTTRGASSDGLCTLYTRQREVLVARRQLLGVRLPLDLLVQGWVISASLRLRGGNAARSLPWRLSTCICADPRTGIWPSV